MNINPTSDSEYMDAEIRAVEEKLSKARGVKAGMMSALLTGKLRLVEQ